MGICAGVQLLHIRISETLRLWANSAVKGENRSRERADKDITKKRFWITCSAALTDHSSRGGEFPRFARKSYKQVKLYDKQIRYYIHQATQ